MAAPVDNAAFEAAVEWIRGADLGLDNSKMLEIYALFKQATVGQCAGDRPGIFDQKGRAKYDAWQALGEMTAEEAKAAYVALATGYGWAGVEPAAEEAAGEAAAEE